MYQYIIRRILVFIPMLLALSIIVFGLAKAAPGDPFTGKILDPNINPEVYEQQREALGLKQTSTCPISELGQGSCKGKLW